MKLSKLKGKLKDIVAKGNDVDILLKQLVKMMDFEITLVENCNERSDKLLQFLDPDNDQMIYQQAEEVCGKMKEIDKKRRKRIHHLKKSISDMLNNLSQKNDELSEISSKLDILKNDYNKTHEHLQMLRTVDPEKLNPGKLNIKKQELQHLKATYVDLHMKKADYKKENKHLTKAIQRCENDLIEAYREFADIKKNRKNSEDLGHIERAQMERIEALGILIQKEDIFNEKEDTFKKIQSETLQSIIEMILSSSKAYHKSVLQEL